MELHTLIWWLAGLVPGLALGWWLRARIAAKPPTRQIADAQPLQSAAEPTPQPVAAPSPPAPPAAVSAPTPADPAPTAPPLDPAPADPALPDPAQVDPAPPAWPEAVQELFDRGQAVEAIVLIRRTLGAPLARKAARERFADPGASAPLPAEVRKLADDGKKLDAIRRLCDLTHMDLPLAQRLVEHYVAHPRR
ncbi:hypothetical protein [Lysobacter enzymogenes]|uniref:Uncharacterized protein n=1 Tax=Lysobacter enzymogenes TaxID=69 RepID=A0A3N2RIE0_LYSEN|nr:hypothetical protein [Lysobacter enzymogenes]ROU07215.1 hypothetical protein D9T17_09605 [Lysobacter enzymogenes]